MRVLWSLESIARTGSTLEALKSICQQAGATCLGAGAIIHNRLNGKTWEGDLETLAQVGSGKQKTGDELNITKAADCYLLNLLNLLVSFLFIFSSSGVSTFWHRPCRGSQSRGEWFGLAGGGGSRCSHRTRDERRYSAARESAEGLLLHQPPGGKKPLLWCPVEDRRVLTFNLNWCLQKWWVSSKTGWFFGTMRFLPSLWFYPSQLCIGGYRLDGHVWAIAGSCLCWLWHFEGSDGTDWRSTPSTCSRLESDLRHSFLDHQIYFFFSGSRPSECWNCRSHICS